MEKKIGNLSKEEQFLLYNAMIQQTQKKILDLCRTQSSRENILELIRLAQERKISFQNKHELCQKLGALFYLQHVPVASGYLGKRKYPG